MDTELYQHKICNVCKIEKSLTEFSTAKAGALGRRSDCKECCKASRRALYARTKEARQIKRKEYDSRPDIRDRRLALRARPEIKAKEKASTDRYRASEKGRETIVSGRKRYESSPEVRAKMLMAATRVRAQKSGLPLEVTEEWVLSKVVAGKCELTGIEFDFTSSLKQTRRNGFLPSIDQIVAGKGYTLDNSRVVLVAVNLAMCEWGLEQFLKLAQATLEFQGYKVTPP